MSEKPFNRITATARPKLVIFDDEENLLLRYVRRFAALGYDVKPVLVLHDTREYDKDLFVNGYLKQDWTAEERQAMLHPPRSEDKKLEKRTVKSAMKDAEARNKTNARYNAEYDYYKCLSQIPYGVCSRSEAEALLRELKPDVVLSDNQMRESGYVPKGTELMGKDIMELSAEMYPLVPRAIHSGVYKVDPRGNEEHKAMQKELLENARKEAEPLGYTVFPKQESALKRSHLAAGPVREIDAYFGSSRIAKIHAPNEKNLEIYR